MKKILYSVNIGIIPFIMLVLWMLSFLESLDYKMLLVPFIIVGIPLFFFIQGVFSAFLKNNVFVPLAISNSAVVILFVSVGMDLAIIGYVLIYSGISMIGFGFGKGIIMLRLKMQTSGGNL
ncbi:hypothetical protein [Bacillus alkalicellulosilyticus]|uniref:hypothetical protein n=1 Tax=Alkalihalobacterium alkalicellulosilyticum TaxID=1912214 RepID=UPI00099638BD|nr:hypothetical protein [Bacillus alkalicellulosilyticus]